MKKSSSITVDINPKQAKVLQSQAKRIAFIGGRGSGKSMTMGFKIGDTWEEFPRATWAVAGLSYVTLDSIIVPSLRDALERQGYLEYDSKVQPNGVYVIGKNPPKKWAKPYKKPGERIVQYCITFINGFTLRMVSQDNKETHRGLSIDGLIVDESATVDFEDFIQTILLPAMRPGSEKAPYLNHPLFGSFWHFSSASWTPKGNWIYDWEQKYLTEQADRRAEPVEWRKANPPMYLFIESTFEDNILNLYPGYGTMLRETMDAWKYNVEVLNNRVLALPDAYYYAFGDQNLYTKAYDYRLDAHGRTTWSSNDYDPTQDLEVTLDFNTDICWVLVYQANKHEDKQINSVFKKPVVTQKEQETSILIQTAQWFIEEYKDNVNKRVYIFGDPNGNSTNAATDKDNRPFFDKWEKELKAAGWTTFRREQTSYPPTKLRYELLNDLYAGRIEHAPRILINMVKNKSFTIALRNTKVDTKKQFKKNKNSEKTSRLREEATDPTDASDYRYWTKYSRFIKKTGWKSSGYRK